MVAGVETQSALRLGSNISHYPDNNQYTPSDGELVLGQYDKIPLTSESISQSAEYTGAETINEGYGLSDEDITRISVQGSINLSGWYDGLDQLLSASLGVYSLSSLSDGYKHTYTISPELDERFTLGIDKGVSVFTYRACKVNSLGIDYRIDEGFGVKADIICFDVARDTSKNGSSSGWDVVSKDKILARQATFTVDGSNMPINEFSLNIDNNLKANKETIQNGKYIAAPVRNGRTKISGTITIPHYSIDTFFNNFYSGTNRNLKLDFTGPKMGSNNKKFTINLPYCKIKNPKANVGGQSSLEHSIDFTANRGTSLSSPVTITTKNEYPNNGGS